MNLSAEHSKPADANAKSAEERAQRLTGTVIGTIVAAGVLAVSAADEQPDAFDAGVYMVATVFVFWLAHGWAHGLGRRDAGDRGSGTIAGLRYELPVLESVLPPLAALALASALGDTDENAITIAAWVCVAELGLFGAGIARREGASPLRMASTAAGCAALGATMIALKAIVH